MNVILGMLIVAGLLPFGLLYGWWMIHTGLRKRWLVLVAQIITLIFAMGVALTWWSYQNQWGFRKALPEGAGDINEWYWEEGFLPDYEYRLKAKMSESEFKQYSEHFSLTSHTASRKYIHPFHGPEWKKEPEAWWDPSPAIDTTFVYQEEPGEKSEGWSHHWIYAKYENGYVYLYAMRW